MSILQRKLRPGIPPTVTILGNDEGCSGAEIWVKEAPGGVVLAMQHFGSCIMETDIPIGVLLNHASAIRVADAILKVFEESQDEADDERPE